jgi:hypothetical protein
MKIRLVGAVLFHNGGQALLAILWKAPKKYTEIVSDIHAGCHKVWHLRQLLCRLCSTELQHVPASTVILREIT